MQYWGYLHTNGTLQIKLLFGDNYIHAWEDSFCKNSFVVFVLGPVEAADGSSARKMLVDQLRERGYEAIGKTSWGETQYQEINAKHR